MTVMMDTTPRHDQGSVGSDWKQGRGMATPDGSTEGLVTRKRVKYRSGRCSSLITMENRGGPINFNLGDVRRLQCYNACFDDGCGSVPAKIRSLAR